MWACLVEEYVAAIAKGRVPTIQNAVDVMAEVENAKVSKAAVKGYIDKMEEIPLPTITKDVLENHSREAEDLALKFFKSKRIFNSGEKYIAELKVSSAVVKAYHVQDTYMYINTKTKKLCGS